jgi:hypothetical protein
MKAGDGKALEGVDRMPERELFEARYGVPKVATMGP